MLIVLKNNRDEEGRILIFDIYGNDSEYILISLNANTEKEQIDLMDNLLELLEEFNTNKKSQLIVARGCNSFVDLKLDAQVGKITLKKKSLAKLVEFKEIYWLCDIWRTRNTNSKRSTFTQKHSLGFIQRRLDYILISNTSQELVTITEILTPVSTDHSPVVVSLY